MVAAEETQPTTMYTKYQQTRKKYSEVFRFEISSAKSFCSTSQFFTCASTQFWYFHNCKGRAVHNLFHLGGNVITWSREHNCSAAVHSRGVWGHAPPGYFGDFRCSDGHNHHCLLSYWNTGNHLHRLGTILYLCLLHTTGMHAQAYIKQ